MPEALYDAFIGIPLPDTIEMAHGQINGIPLPDLLGDVVKYAISQVDGVIEPDNRCVYVVFRTLIFKDSLPGKAGACVFSNGFRGRVFGGSFALG